MVIAGSVLAWFVAPLLKTQGCGCTLVLHRRSTQSDTAVPLCGFAVAGIGILGCPPGTASLDERPAGLKSTPHGQPMHMLHDPQAGNYFWGFNQGPPGHSGLTTSCCMEPSLAHHAPVPARHPTTSASSTLPIDTLLASPVEDSARYLSERPLAATTPLLGLTSSS